MKDFSLLYLISSPIETVSIVLKKEKFPINLLYLICSRTLIWSSTSNIFDICTDLSIKRIIEPRDTHPKKLHLEPLSNFLSPFLNSSQSIGSCLREPIYLNLFPFLVLYPSTSKNSDRMTFFSKNNFIFSLNILPLFLIGWHIFLKNNFIFSMNILPLLLIEWHFFKNNFLFSLNILPYLHTYIFYISI